MVKHVNTLNIAVNHWLMSWGATFCCCQMCLLVKTKSIKHVVVQSSDSILRSIIGLEHFDFQSDVLLDFQLSPFYQSIKTTDWCPVNPLLRRPNAEMSTSNNGKQIRCTNDTATTTSAYLSAWHVQVELGWRCPTALFETTRRWAADVRCQIPTSDVTVVIITTVI